MTNVSTQLVEGYLGRLRQLLAEAEPTERAEILADVREHLRDSLDGLEHEPTETDVRRALADLGSPEDVADAWAANGGARVAAPIAAGGSRLPAVALIVLAVCSLFAIIIPPVGVALQLVVLAVALIAARRDARHRGLYGTAAGIAVFGLLAAVVAALTLVSSGEGPAEPATPVPASSVPAQTS